MDLSAVIFVVLALAWAVYLIPKALKHHDEVAAERLEESHSERARVLSRRRTTLSEGGLTVEEAQVVESEHGTPARHSRLARVLGVLSRPRADAPELTTAGRAARNRRRVLAGLLLTLAVTWVLTWFAYLPSITPLWPSLAVAGWLVLARVSVVRMQQARRAPYAERRATPAAPDAAAEPFETVAARPPQGASFETVAPVRQPATATELAGLARTTFDARPEVVAEATALADDGSLWDPLPLTLPTYVGKATARRTVRTIELTGMTSSGHDDADSALARETEAAEAAELAASEQRRVAGA